jgi:hypothetical protein
MCTHHEAKRAVVSERQENDAAPVSESERHAILINSASIMATAVLSQRRLQLVLALAMFTEKLPLVGEE